MKKHKNLIYPQWQGGNDISTYFGAKEIEQLYLSDVTYKEVPVSTFEELKLENDIIGYQEILEQMKCAAKIISHDCPQTLFTVGGSCDADFPPIAYLNHKYEGNLTVLWLDAHGDLNTPGESPSKLFYGMPLRALLGEGDAEILKLLESPLTPSQVILSGVRDLDANERNYISENNITLQSVREIEDNMNIVMEAVKNAGNDNIYLHIDLDVMEPDEFPYTPVHAAGGVSVSTFLSILQSLKKFNIVGVGIFEYNTANRKTELITSIIDTGLHL